MIEIVSNKTMFGKVIKYAPYKAVLDGETICTGKTKTDVKNAAFAILAEVYKHRGLTHTYVRVANDGTIYVGKITARNEMEIFSYRPVEGGNGATKIGASLLGSFGNGTFEGYLKFVVDDYNTACGPQINILGTPLLKEKPKCDLCGKDDCDGHYGEGWQ